MKKLSESIREIIKPHQPICYSSPHSFQYPLRSIYLFICFSFSFSLVIKAIGYVSGWFLLVFLPIYVLLNCNSRRKTLQAPCFIMTWQIMIVAYGQSLKAEAFRFNQTFPYIISAFYNQSGTNVNKISRWVRKVRSGRRKEQERGIKRRKMSGIRTKLEESELLST